MTGLRKTGLGIAAAVLIGGAAIYPRAVHGHGDDGAVEGVFEQETLRVIAGTGGVVTAVSAHEGDGIAAGSVLVELDNGEQRLKKEKLLELRRQYESVRSLAAMVQSLPASSLNRMIDRSPAVQTAEKEYVAVMAQSEASPSEKNQAALSAAAERREMARREASRTLEDAARSKSTGFEEELRWVQTEIDRARVTSPVAGTVDILQLRPGDVVLPGQPVAAIALPGRFYIELSVDAEQGARFQDGQDVRVLSEGARELHGHVRHVENSHGIPVAVRVEVLDPPASLRSGTRAKVLP
jgi:multidrug resistance efflux pump